MQDLISVGDPPSMAAPSRALTDRPISPPKYQATLLALRYMVSPQSLSVLAVHLELALNCPLALQYSIASVARARPRQLRSRKEVRKSWFDVIELGRIAPWFLSLVSVFLRCSDFENVLRSRPRATFDGVRRTRCLYW